MPNGLALTAPEGSGELKGFWVETAADPAAAPTADNVPGGHPDRVFAGLTRKLTAAGHDETYGPAEGTPRWSAAHPGVGQVDGEGVFHARRAGSTEVTARQGQARGSTKLEVVGELDRLRPTRERVGLADGDAEGSFGLIGFDAQGTSAPVEPADARTGLRPFALRRRTGRRAGRVHGQGPSRSGVGVGHRHGHGRGREHPARGHRGAARPEGGGLRRRRELEVQRRTGGGLTGRRSRRATTGRA